ncbi:LPXTG cell wall anchor domain-containing protein, partial [Listeria monocytogenes]|nr:LPXTG cell wall anchor domain-containing protein [Listeria monocytogenes]
LSESESESEASTSESISLSESESEASTSALSKSVQNDGKLAKTGDASMLSLQGIGAGLIASLSSIWVWAKRKRKSKEVK